MTIRFAQCCLPYAVAALILVPSAAAAQAITAATRPGQTPAWSKGIIPVNPESYYSAIECGKQGGADPPCVFWDTGLCKNPEFTLTFYTGYKAVAYEVWQAVSHKQPAPQPNYAEAQRTRITIAVKQVAGAKDPLKSFVVKHGGKVMASVDQSIAGGGGRFTFDYPAFAPTADVTLDLVGQTKTISCLIPQPVLKTLR